MDKITIPTWLKELGNVFAKNRFELYLVGGAVRYQLLNLPVNEWDATTNALPSEIKKLLREAGYQNISTIGEKFGTITATFNSEPIDITTYRSEDYQEISRKPVVEFGKTLHQDLARRDFTINAIAADTTDGQIYDPYGGVGDIEKKIVKAVGSAEERFIEDPLRMLRAIRFVTKLNFELDQQTKLAITKERVRFAILSAERVASEMNKILLTIKPSAGIELLRETGLLDYILPELLASINLEFDPTEHKDIYHHILQVLDQTPPKLELRWCALLHDIAKPQTRRKIGREWHFLGHEVVGAKISKVVLRRLKYSNEFVDYVSQLIYLHQRITNDDGQWTDGAVRRFVRDAGNTLDDLFAFAAADSTSTNTIKIERYAKSRQILMSRIKKLEEEAEIAKIKSPLSGQELMELFKRPAGPWIKPIKEKLLSLVLDGELKEDDKAKATDIAKQMVKH